MNTPTVLSDSSTRQKRGKKKLFLKSCGIRSHKEILDSSNCQRSSSLSTLIGQGNINLSGSPAQENVQPRMAQLETLEAKMAHIEVSLSVTPRRKRGGSIGGGSLGISSFAPSTPVLTSAGSRIGRDAMRDPRNTFPDKDTAENRSIEQTLSTMSLNRSFVGASQERSTPDLVAVVPQRVAAMSKDYCNANESLEERATAVQIQIDNKRSAIKNLKLALERLDITDNIDVRIQQAELEYRLGREELELLTLHEHGRALNAMLAERNDHENEDGSQKQTLFACVNLSENQSIFALEIEYDPKSPRFGAGYKRSLPGLWVEWAVEHINLRKGDRLIEVNGKLVISCRSKEELCRLLSISPSPAQVVVLRSAASVVSSPNGNNLQMNSLKSRLKTIDPSSEITRTKEVLQADNLRLTHRISYLEEQVAELLTNNKITLDEKEIRKSNQIDSPSTVKANYTDTNIISDTSGCKVSQPKSEIQLFQKGPDITAIVANLPGLGIGAKNTAENTSSLPIIRPKSNMSNVTFTQNTYGNKNNRPHSVNSIGNSEYDCRNDYRHSENYHKSHKCHGKLQYSKNHSVDKQSLEKLNPLLERKHHSHQSSDRYLACTNQPQNDIDYNTETSAALEIIKRNQRHYLDKVTLRNIKIRESFMFENSTKNATVHKQSIPLSNISDHNLTEFKNTSAHNNRVKDEYGQHFGSNEFNVSKSVYRDQFENKDSTHHKSKNHSKQKEQANLEFNPDRDYVNPRIDGKILESTHKSSRRHSKLHSRSIKSLDFDSETSDSVNTSFSNFQKSTKSLTDPDSSMHNNYRKYIHSIKEDVYLRPAPPKKPLRLSLHRVQSSQSDCERHENNYKENNSEITENNDKRNSLKNISDSANLCNIQKHTSSNQKYTNHLSKRDSTPFDLSPLLVRKPTKRSFKGNIGDSKHKICTKSISTNELKSHDSLQDVISIEHKYDKKSSIDANTTNCKLTLNSSNIDNNRSKAQNTTGYNLIRWSLSTNKLLVNENNAKYNGNLSDGGKWC